MSDDAAGNEVDDEPAILAPAPGRALRIALVAIIAVAVLVVAGTAGWLIRGGASSSSMPSNSSVDAGFARDMATHHTQAVTMAGYERDNTSNPQLQILAFDIETSQEFQIGEMQGWLDTWNLSRNSTHPMAWMGHAGMAMGPNALMPGMATPAQMTKLETLHGKALDVMFLQLMIHHHQGGVPMAQYAAAHAQTSYVRDLARNMAAVQNGEIVTMEQLLRQLGGSPLPPPSS
ncbi:MAG TPA: DUF305 domain-containing protein [Jatrophihabitans sp.]|nr:DUF305 domain-containing protein [Jatrophihabitans sp.]